MAKSDDAPDSKRRPMAHDELYWERIRRDFRSCTYFHGGAYTPYESRQRAEHVDIFGRQIAAVEKRFKTRRSDGLSAYGGSKASLDPDR